MVIVEGSGEDFIRKSYRARVTPSRVPLRSWLQNFFLPVVLTANPAGNKAAAKKWGGQTGPKNASFRCFGPASPPTSSYRQKGTKNLLSTLSIFVEAT